MSYTISLSIAITTDRATATITDSTVFGGSNPNRSAVRVFLSGNKQTVDNTVDYALTLTPNNTDPAVVSSWSWPYQDTDGWINFFYVIIKAAYAGGTSYNIYDAVYDSGTNLVYRSKANSNVGHSLSDTTWWELITDPSTLAANKGETNESLNIESTIYQRVLSYSAQYNYGNFISDASSECCGDCAESEAVTEYKLLSLLVNGLITADERTELPQGETIARRLSGIFGTC